MSWPIVPYPVKQPKKPPTERDVEGLSECLNGPGPRVGAGALRHLLGPELTMCENKRKERKKKDNPQRFNNNMSHLS